MMNIGYDKGLNIFDMVIDTSKKVKSDNLVITHAHSDHVSLTSEGRTYLTPETNDLVEERYGKVKNPELLKFNQKVKNDDYSFQFIESGHILGSSQVIFEAEKDILVTSDFKTTDSLITKGAKPQDCDILIMESTFGKPEYEFPGRDETYLKMEEWASRHIEKGRMVVFNGYSLGKAQELTAFSNEFLRIEPLVHESIFNINKIYRKHGVKVGKDILLDKNMKESQVLIIPPSLSNKTLYSALEFASGKKIVNAVASGFSAHFGGKTFPLSDHSSFSELLDFVEQCNPSMVYTFHGFDEELAFAIRKKLSISAKALNKSVKGQSVLQEY